LECAWSEGWLCEEPHNMNTSHMMRETLGLNALSKYNPDSNPNESSGEDMEASRK